MKSLIFSFLFIMSIIGPPKVLGQVDLYTATKLGNNTSGLFYNVTDAQIDTLMIVNDTLINGELQKEVIIPQISVEQEKLPHQIKVNWYAHYDSTKHCFQSTTFINTLAEGPGTFFLNGDSTTYHFGKGYLQRLETIFPGGYKETMLFQNGYITDFKIYAHGDLISHTEYRRDGTSLKTTYRKPIHGTSYMFSQTNFRNGLLHGSYTTYYETGEITRQGEYENGVLISMQFFERDGTLMDVKTEEEFTKEVLSRKRESSDQ